MKKIFKIFISVAIFAIGFFFGQYSAKLEIPLREVRTEKEIRVSLSFGFGEENIKTFEDIKLEGKKTVFDLLKKVTQENNLEFSFKEYSDVGVFIESIDNMTNDSTNNKFWQYWVNSEYAQIGASSFILEDGDLVEWKYIEGQF